MRVVIQLHFRDDFSKLSHTPSTIFIIALLIESYGHRWTQDLPLTLWPLTSLRSDGLLLVPKSENLFHDIWTHRQGAGNHHSRTWQRNSWHLELFSRIWFRPIQAVFVETFRAIGLRILGPFSSAKFPIMLLCSPLLFFYFVYCLTIVISPYV